MGFNVRTPHTIDSKFNRLVVMQTDPASWHSVSRVLVDQPRYCLSNYLFSTRSPTGVDFRHVTTFTGRPEEPLKRGVLKVVDTAVLNALGRYLPALTQRTKHRIKP